MNRYVILRHSPANAASTRPLHWDLMFELEEELLTWAVAVFPWKRKTVVPATRLAPHRLHYLDFEGELTGQRGRVQRCAAGVYQLIEHQPQSWRAELLGHELRGIVQLSRQPHHDDKWTLLWHGNPERSA